MATESEELVVAVAHGEGMKCVVVGLKCADNLEWYVNESCKAGMIGCGDLEKNGV
jgi:hypothetical protein